MRAVILQNGQLDVGEVADPAPGPGQLLTRVLACGICGSDLHAAKHLDELIRMQERNSSGALSTPLDPAAELVMGHEFCCEVIDVGDGVDRSRIGDRVVSLPLSIASGTPRTIGYSNHHSGGFADHLVLDDMLCLSVPGDCSTDIAVLTEPAAVALHAVNKATLDPEHVALVVGCGPVGLGVIAWLRHKGHGPIVAADFSPARRALAEALGADVVVDPTVESPYGSWEDLAWPADADRANPMIRMMGVVPKPTVVFECVGVPGIIDQVMDGSIRDSRVMVVGVCMGTDTFEPTTGIAKELELRFVLGYSAEEFAESLETLAAGSLGLDRLLTGVVNLDGTPQAFVDLADPEQHAKILVKPD